MRLHPLPLLFLAAAALLVGCGAPHCDGLEWEPFPAIAPGTPYGEGVSALYAGETGGALLAAGGANFPDEPAAEGGTKHFYDDVWLLHDGDSVWCPAGRMPCPSAYGAAYAFDDEVIVAGGANASGSLESVWSLRTTGDSVALRMLPDLPLPVEQAASAMAGERLYLVGGLSNGVPSTGLYGCAADTFEWRRIAELPEPLVQPVAYAGPGRLYVWGGYNPVEKRAVDYGYRYDFDSQRWGRIAGPPDGGTLTGAASVVCAKGAERLLVVGGVDRDVFTEALRLPPDKVGDYLRLPPEAYGFRCQAWLFDPTTERWTELGEDRAGARAGAALALTRRGIVLLGGELKPGIRTSENVRTAALD